MSEHTPARHAALVEAQRTAETAQLIQEIHGDRCLFGFDASPCLFVVAPRKTSTLGLAILIIEQIAIATIQQQIMQAAQSVSQLQGMNAIGGIQ
jgi:hypothetical protein